MKQLLFFFVGLFSFFLVQAQSSIFFTDATYIVDFQEDMVLNAHVSAGDTELRLSPSITPLLSQKLPIPLLGGDPFITAALQYDGPSDEQLLGQFAIRFSKDGTSWQDWISIHEDMHIPDESRQSNFTGQLLFADATDQFFQIAIYPKSGHDIEFSQIQVVFSAPGNSTHQPTADADVQSRSICPLPNYQGRSDWCSLGECPFGSDQVFTTVTHLIVHHSAGSNTSSDWAAVVRAIWHYHVDTKGWDDIGYNWLIDANGIIYQGRKDDIRGAHFSGHNTGTMGVCVMGNFHNATPKVAPKPAAIEALDNLLCWKTEKEGLDAMATTYHAASGLNLKTISGHRDGGSTSCPGDSLYIQLPRIRFVVDSLLNPVGILDVTPNSGLITITPTLAHDQIQLKYVTPFQPKLTFQIFSLSGEKMQQADIQEDTYIDVGHLPKGIFIVRILGREILDVFRIVRM